ncbi:MAG: ATP synthase F1 subunit gamma [Myxococcales bacterium]|jgi:F-type H+-transporting ATPase subunit gamma|nr:ATP synthase F1 subunit gamma [Myxococcales bacterium]
MGSIRQLKSRIRSVSNTKQITKAMQMVAASKMRRAQETAKSALPYTQAALDILSHFAAQGIVWNHPWFVARPVKTRLLILIAADKGLAGAYNANAFKEYLVQLQADRKNGVANQTIAVGRKASQFVTRLKNVVLAGSYADLPENPECAQFHAILQTAQAAYEAETVDAVDIIFTEFVSSMTQTATTQRLFPAGFTKSEVPGNMPEAKYEPSVGHVLKAAAYRLISAQLFQALLDSRASEHSMRMMAMKSATDNATELVDDLTLAMNKARQGAITQELTEISAGVEAMS